jgi:hypothetical protein
MALDRLPEPIAVALSVAADLERLEIRYAAVGGSPGILGPRGLTKSE